jgi:hypothetical protein
MRSVRTPKAESSLESIGSSMQMKGFIKAMRLPIGSGLTHFNRREADLGHSATDRGVGNGANVLSSFLIGTQPFTGTILSLNSRKPTNA